MTDVTGWLDWHLPMAEYDVIAFGMKIGNWQWGCDVISLKHELA